MKNLTKAVIAVMNSVSNVEKGMTIGSGNSKYHGVSDKDVKEIIRKAMAENGLCLIPTGVNATTKIDRWEEENQYGKRTKQSVLTEVTTTYTLLHESGESIEVAGYGHGQDPQDKAAGKATTYALKYALLYLFLVPTGAIDDADVEHSNDKEVPKPVRRAVKEDKPQPKEVNKTAPKAEKVDEVLEKHHQKFLNLLASKPTMGVIKGAVGKALTEYKISPETLKEWLGEGGVKEDAIAKLVN